MNGCFFCDHVLNIVKRSYSSMMIVKQVLNVYQHSHYQNTFTRVSFLINRVPACNLNLSFSKKRFTHWCFPRSYLNFLRIRFLKREKKNRCDKRRSIVMTKKHCLSDIYGKYNYATFYVTSTRFLYFSTVHGNKRFYIVSSV